MGRADVVILGGGLAGCCAALGAVESGARALLLEKAKSGAGSTWQSAGTFAFAGTDLQAEAGYQDSGEQLGEELIRVGGGHNDRALIQRFAQEQLDTYGWLKSQGVLFERVQLSGGQGVPRSHATDPVQLMQALQDRLAANPLFERRDHVRAQALTKLEKGWGVQCVDGEVEAGAVVIATGGFSRSAEYVQTFAPELAVGTPLGGFENSGDGLRMAMAAGCGLADMGYVKGTFGMPLASWPNPSQTPPAGFFLLMPIYRGGIAVNLHGRRFTDESRSYKEIGAACLNQPQGVAFQLFDALVMAQAQRFPANMNFAEALERGLVRQGATIADVATTVGIDPAALEETVARYNDIARAGRDTDFGRAVIAGSVGALRPLDQGPFFVVPCGVAITGTFCGVRVDADAHVLNPFGQVIADLFAAGEVVGGFHGESYMSGSALAKAALFGRIAGVNAAEQR